MKRKTFARVTSSEIKDDFFALTFVADVVYDDDNNTRPIEVAVKLEAPNYKFEVVEYTCRLPKDYVHVGAYKQNVNMLDYAFVYELLNELEQYYDMAWSDENCKTETIEQKAQLFFDAIARHNENNALEIEYDNDYCYGGA